MIVELQNLRYAVHDNRWVFYCARELASLGARNKALIREGTNTDSKQKLRGTFYLDLDVVCIMNFNSSQTSLDFGNRDYTVVH